MIVTCRPILTYLEKLQVYLDSKETVEIFTEGQEITGVLSDVGEDYLAIVFAREREITTTVAVSGEDKTEKQKSIQVAELETVIRLVDIHAISRIIRQVNK